MFNSPTGLNIADLQHHFEVGMTPRITTGFRRFWCRFNGCGGDFLCERRAPQRTEQKRRDDGHSRGTWPVVVIIIVVIVLIVAGL
jgi:hypothetical protein